MPRGSPTTTSKHKINLRKDPTVKSTKAIKALVSAKTTATKASLKKLDKVVPKARTSKKTESPKETKDDNKKGRRSLNKNITIKMNSSKDESAKSLNNKISKSEKDLKDTTKSKKTVIVKNENSDSSISCVPSTTNKSQDVGVQKISKRGRKRKAESNMEDRVNSDENFKERDKESSLLSDQEKLTIKKIKITDPKINVSKQKSVLIEKAVKRSEHAIPNKIGKEEKNNNETMLRMSEQTNEVEVRKSSRKGDDENNTNRKSKCLQNKDASSKPALESSVDVNKNIVTRSNEILEKKSDASCTLSQNSSSNTTEKESVGSRRTRLTVRRTGDVKESLKQDQTKTKNKTDEVTKNKISGEKISSEVKKGDLSNKDISSSLKECNSKTMRKTRSAFKKDDCLSEDSTDSVPFSESTGELQESFKEDKIKTKNKTDELMKSNSSKDGVFSDVKKVDISNKEMSASKEMNTKITRKTRSALKKDDCLSEDSRDSLPLSESIGEFQETFKQDQIKTKNKTGDLMKNNTSGDGASSEVKNLDISNKELSVSKENNQKITRKTRSSLKKDDCLSEDSTDSLSFSESTGEFQKFFKQDQIKTRNKTDELMKSDTPKDRVSSEVKKVDLSNKEMSASKENNPIIPRKTRSTLKKDDCLSEDSTDSLTPSELAGEVKDVFNQDQMKTQNKTDELTENASEVRSSCEVKKIDVSNQEITSASKEHSTKIIRKTRSTLKKDDCLSENTTDSLTPSESTSKIKESFKLEQVKTKNKTGELTKNDSSEVKKVDLSNQEITRILKENPKLTRKTRSTVKKADCLSEDSTDSLSESAGEVKESIKPDQIKINVLTKHTSEDRVSSEGNKMDISNQEVITTSKENNTETTRKTRSTPKNDGCQSENSTDSLPLSESMDEMFKFDSEKKNSTSMLTLKKEKSNNEDDELKAINKNLNSLHENSKVAEKNNLIEITETDANKESQLNFVKENRRSTVKCEINRRTCKMRSNVKNKEDKDLDVKGKLGDQTLSDKKKLKITEIMKSDALSQSKSVDEKSSVAIKSDTSQESHEHKFILEDNECKNAAGKKENQGDNNEVKKKATEFIKEENSHCIFESVDEKDGTLKVSSVKDNVQVSNLIFKKEDFDKEVEKVQDESRCDPDSKKSKTLQVSAKNDQKVISDEIIVHNRIICEDGEGKKGVQKDKPVCDLIHSQAANTVLIKEEMKLCSDKEQNTCYDVIDDQKASTNDLVEDIENKELITKLLVRSNEKCDNQIKIENLLNMGNKESLVETNISKYEKNTVIVVEEKIGDITLPRNSSNIAKDESSESVLVNLNEEKNLSDTAGNITISNVSNILVTNTKTESLDDLNANKNSQDIEQSDYLIKTELNEEVNETVQENEVENVPLCTPEQLESRNEEIATKISEIESVKVESLPEVVQDKSLANHIPDQEISATSNSSSEAVNLDILTENVVIKSPVSDFISEQSKSLSAIDSTRIPETAENNCQQSFTDIVKSDCNKSKVCESHINIERKHGAKYQELQISTDISENNSESISEEKVCVIAKLNIETNNDSNLMSIKNKVSDLAPDIIAEEQKNHCNTVLTTNETSSSLLPDESRCVQNVIQTKEVTELHVMNDVPGTTVSCSSTEILESVSHFSAEKVNDTASNDMKIEENTDAFIKTSKSITEDNPKIVISKTDNNVAQAVSDFQSETRVEKYAVPKKITEPLLENSNSSLSKINEADKNFIEASNINVTVGTLLEDTEIFKPTQCETINQEEMLTQEEPIKEIVYCTNNNRIRNDECISDTLVVDSKQLEVQSETVSQINETSSECHLEISLHEIKSDNISELNIFQNIPNVLETQSIPEVKSDVSSIVEENANSFLKNFEHEIDKKEELKEINIERNQSKNTTVNILSAESSSVRKSNVESKSVHIPETFSKKSESEASAELFKDDIIGHNAQFSKENRSKNIADLDMCKQFVEQKLPVSKETQNSKGEWSKHFVAKDSEEQKENAKHTSQNQSTGQKIEDSECFGSNSSIEIIKKNESSKIESEEILNIKSPNSNKPNVEISNDLKSRNINSNKIIVHENNLLNSETISEDGDNDKDSLLTSGVSVKEIGDELPVEVCENSELMPNTKESSLSDSSSVTELYHSNDGDSTDANTVDIQITDEENRVTDNKEQTVSETSSITVVSQLSDDDSTQVNDIVTKANGEENSTFPDIKEGTINSASSITETYHYSDDDSVKNNDASINEIDLEKTKLTKSTDEFCTEVAEEATKASKSVSDKPFDSSVIPESETKTTTEQIALINDDSPTVKLIQTMNYDSIETNVDSIKVNESQPNNIEQSCFQATVEESLILDEVSGKFIDCDSTTETTCSSPASMLEVCENSESKTNSKENESTVENSTLDHNQSNVVDTVRNSNKIVGESSGDSSLSEINSSLKSVEEKKNPTVLNSNELTDNIALGAICSSEAVRKEVSECDLSDINLKKDTTKQKKRKIDHIDNFSTASSEKKTKIASEKKDSTKSLKTTVNITHESSDCESNYQTVSQKELQCGKLSNLKVEHKILDLVNSDQNDASNGSVCVPKDKIKNGEKVVKKSSKKKKLPGKIDTPKEKQKPGSDEKVKNRALKCDSDQEKILSVLEKSKNTTSDSAIKEKNTVSEINVGAGPSKTSSKRKNTDVEAFAEESKRFKCNDTPVRQYLDQFVPFLLEGLLKIAYNRPPDPIQYLADWMMFNKEEAYRRIHVSR